MVGIRTFFWNLGYSTFLLFHSNSSYKTFFYFFSYDFQMVCYIRCQESAAFTLTVDGEVASRRSDLRNTTSHNFSFTQIMHYEFNDRPVFLVSFL